MTEKGAGGRDQATIQAETRKRASERAKTARAVRGCTWAIGDGPRLPLMRGLGGPDDTWPTCYLASATNTCASWLRPVHPMWHDIGRGIRVAGPVPPNSKIHPAVASHCGPHAAAPQFAPEGLFIGPNPAFQSDTNKLRRRSRAWKIRA